MRVLMKKYSNINASIAQREENRIRNLEDNTNEKKESHIVFNSVVIPLKLKHRVSWKVFVLQCSLASFRQVIVG